METLTRTQVLVAMAITAIVLLVISKIWLHLGRMQLIPVEFQPGEIAIGVGMGLCFTIGSFILYRVWGGYRESADAYLDLVIKPLAWFDLLWLGLLPGMSEELLFRGVMLPSFGYDYFGAIVAAICFGVLHINGRKQWSYGIWAAAIGLSLGLSLLWTNNLLVPIIAHITTNLLSGLWWKYKLSSRPSI
jgi:uncharacterized protein